MSGAPRVDPKRRIALRLASILAAYVTYRVMEPQKLSAGIFAGVGVLLLGYALTTYLTTSSDERSGLMQTGQTILGGVLILLGIGQLLT